MYIHILPPKPSVEHKRKPAATAAKRKTASEAAAESVETCETVKSETPHIFHLPKNSLVYYMKISDNGDKTITLM